MAALLTINPPSPVASTGASAIASGGGAYMNRLLLDGTLIESICTDDAFTQGFNVPSSTGSHTLEWEQLIAGVWTLADDITFTVVAAPASSSAMVITSSNTTIDGKSFSAPTSNGPIGTRTIFITTSGSSAASPFDNVTISNCTFSGGTISIWLRWVTNFTIENCLFEDADYAGAMIWSGIHETIQNNTVRRIGAARTDMSDTSFLNNAYGITTNRNESASLVIDPVSEDVLIDSNIVDYVPIWQGINTHGGKDHTFSNNQVSRCPRGIFIAGSPTGAGTTQCVNATVTSNLITAPVTKLGGTTDLEGILYASVTTIAINDNGIQYNAVDPYGGNTIGSPGYFDYGNASTGESFSGNYLIP